MACVVTTFDVAPGDFRYAVVPGASHALVPTLMVVKCTEAPHFVVALAADSLPFGFLESVTVRTEAPVDVRVTLRKTTGERSSARGPSGVALYTTRGGLSNDNDAADPGFQALFRATGQDLKHRMVVADEVLQVIVEFYAAPPPEFHVELRGANAVPADVYPVKVLGQGTLLGTRLLFPPVAPSARLAHARDTAAALKK